MKGSDRKAAPSPEVLRQRAEMLIQRESTLTLATAREGFPWAAPVYYVYRGGGFYFFSDPASRHITDAMENGRAAGAIHSCSRSWEEIQGLQMAGRLVSVSPGPEAVRAIGSYLARFPFVLDFFVGPAAGLKEFRQRFGVHLYRFHPEECYYLDNRLRFGFRERIPLPRPNLEPGEKQAS